MVDEIIAEAKSKSTDEDDYIKIVPLPKVVFFYPTAFISLVCGITMSLQQDGMSIDNPTGWVKAAGWLFMAVFTSNVMVISFDFPGVKFLAVGLALIAIVLGVALISNHYPDFVPALSEFVNSIKPVALSQFYYFISIVLWVAILTAAGVARVTNIWYLHSNELVHKRGILGDVEKYPTINLRVTKEITDLFEFLLLMSGSLVFQPTTTDRPIVLENVWRINYKEKRIRDLLAKWKVGA